MITVYQGNFRDGMPHGYGIYTSFTPFRTGDDSYILENEYAGSWAFGKRQGQGRMLIKHTYEHAAKGQEKIMYRAIGAWTNNYSHGKVGVIYHDTAMRMYQFFRVFYGDYIAGYQHGTIVRLDCSYFSTVDDDFFMEKKLRERDN